ncbi:MAG TPA: cell division ATPase MinD [archaeon]|nr:cell division ATPase MinD [archaeon]
MTRVLAVIGGKGGVGKTSLVSNLSAAISDLGHDVVAVDANLTTPNLGLHLGMHLAPKTLHDVLKGKARLKDATYPHASGMKVVPGSMALDDLKGVDVGKLPEVALNLLGNSDFVIMDSAAGLGREAVSAISAADEILIITNPDLPSVTDALKTVKIAEEMNKKIIGVAVNRRANKWHELTKGEIAEMCGYPVIAEIPEDKSITKAIAAKHPAVHLYPSSPASQEIRRLAHTLTATPYRERRQMRFGFLDRLVNWMQR